MSHLQLTDDQHSASVAFTDFLLNKDEKYMVIQGSAGTGKSTLVKHLIDTMKPRMKLYSVLLGEDKSLGDFSIELTATTNKAAVVLAELSGTDPRTIHSKLGLTPKPNFETGELDFVKGKNYQIISNTLLIIDEASFISNQLYKDIDSSTVKCKIILVGDQYQLAPVRQTESIMETLNCMKVSLNQIVRHNGPIADLGAQFREAVKTGQFTDISPDGVDIIHVDGPTFQQMIDETFTDSVYTSDRARVIAWTNTKVQQYNNHIRKVKGFSDDLGINDVLITNRAISKNKKMYFNTDAQVDITAIGDSVTYMGISGRMVQLDYGTDFFLPDDQFQVNALLKQLAKAKDWPTHYRIKEEWLDLRPMFASTVHKAQGSTYDTVFINLSDIGRCNIASDVARMMYVAITRASKRVVLYGSLPDRYRGIS